MKILVISDTHMYNEPFIRVVKKLKKDVDMIIHCGDSSLPMDSPLLSDCDIVVKGNHDLEDFPIYQKVENICITHGQYYNVYAGYNELLDLCQKTNCQICLHGHTHVPTYQEHEGILFINPGSLMMNRGSYGYGTYAILDIDNDNIKVHFYHHMTDEICDQSIIDEGLELLEEFKDIIKKTRLNS